MRKAELELHPMHANKTFLKRFLPKSLYGRALLILVLPTLLIQIFTAYVFFDRHLHNVTRYFSNSLAGEIAFFVKTLQYSSPSETTRNFLISEFEKTTNIDVELLRLEDFTQIGNEPKEFQAFRTRMSNQIGYPYSMERINDDRVRITVQLLDETLAFTFTNKRLEPKTVLIFTLWMIGATLIFLLIAVLFLRNQIRPIQVLAQAADKFGRGQDMPEFKPGGAKEVRMAARAFLVMRERIKRQIKTRIDMLSGISHDLRTPLTRMKLQLEMVQDDDARNELTHDVQQMEHMIQEYLDFAQGESGEEPVELNFNLLIWEVIGEYQRMNAHVQFTPESEITLRLKPLAIRRVLYNLIDNAIRYGTSCMLHLEQVEQKALLTVTDNGPGIPKEQRDDVFRPFNRLDTARNVNTGGAGLGLTITRDAVQSHGGTITLQESDLGGLKVIVTLPL